MGEFMDSDKKNIDDKKVKQSVLTIDIENKIAEALNSDKPWLFYEAQIELDDLIKMVNTVVEPTSGQGGPVVRGGTTPSPRGGPPINRGGATPSPRGGPPINRGGATPSPRGGPPITGRGPVSSNVKKEYKLGLLTDLLDGKSENAKEGIVYLGEDGKYVVRAPFGVVHVGNLELALKDKKMDLSDIETKLEDSTFKNTILSITNHLGLTKQPHPGYTLTLMSTLKDSKPENAEIGKFYLDTDGNYIVRAPNRELRKYTLKNEANIDLTDLENKLDDEEFKNNILSVTSKRGDTQLIAPDKQELKYIHDQFKHLKILMADNTKVEETKSFLNDLKTELNSALPTKGLVVSPLFNLQMDIFTTGYLIKKNLDNVQEEVAELTDPNKKVKNQSDVIKSMKTVQSFMEKSPANAAEKEKSFEFNRNEIIEKLTKDKGNTKSFLSNYIEIDAFRNEVNTLSDKKGEKVFQDEDVLKAITSLGLLKEAYTKLKENKVAALADWESKKPNLGVDEQNAKKVLEEEYEQAKSISQPDALDALEEKYEEDKVSITKKYEDKKNVLEADRKKLISQQDALIQNDPNLLAFLENRTKLEKAIKQIDLVNKLPLLKLDFKLEAEKDTITSAISDEKDALNEIKGALDYISKKENFKNKDEKDVKAIENLIDVQPLVINIYNDYSKLASQAINDISKAKSKTNPLLNTKAIEALNSKILSNEKFTNQSISSINSATYPAKSDLSLPTQEEQDNFALDNQNKVNALKQKFEDFKSTQEKEIEKTKKDFDSLTIQTEQDIKNIKDSLNNFYKQIMTQLESDILNNTEATPKILGNTILLEQLKKIKPDILFQEENALNTIDNNLNEFLKTNLENSINGLSTENAELIKDELREYLPIRADALNAQIEFNNFTVSQAKQCEAAVTQIVQNGEIHLPSIFSTKDVLEKVKERLISDIFAINIVYKAPKVEVSSAASNLEVVKTLQEATFILPTTEKPTGDFFELKSDGSSGTRLNFKAVFTEEAGKVKCTDVHMLKQLTELTSKGAQLPTIVLIGLASGYLKAINPPGFKINSRIIKYTNNTTPKDNIRIDVKKLPVFEKMISDVYAQINAEKQNYEIFLKSDLKENESPKEKALYLEKQGDKLAYVGLNPKFDSDQAEDPMINPKTVAGLINIDLQAEELTEDTIAHFKADILNETAKVGHTLNKILPEKQTMQQELETLISTADCKIEVSKLGIKAEVEAKSPTVFKVEFEKAEAIKRAEREKAREPVVVTPVQQPTPRKSVTPVARTSPPISSPVSGNNTTSKPSNNTTPKVTPTTEKPTEKSNPPLLLSESLNHPVKTINTNAKPSKSLKELKSEIREQKAKREVINTKISNMIFIKTEAPDVFHGSKMGGDIALDKLKKEKSTLDASINELDAQIKLASGVGENEIDDSSLQITKMISNLEGGAIVKKEEQIEVLKSASKSIKTLKTETERLEILQNLPKEIFDNRTKTPLVDLFKNAATSCNNESEFKKVCADILGVIKTNSQRGLTKDMIPLQVYAKSANYNDHAPTIKSSSTKVTKK